MGGNLTQFKTIYLKNALDELRRSMISGHKKMGVSSLLTWFRYIPCMNFDVRFGIVKISSLLYIPNGRYV
jgi:hypothetical protein